MHFFSVNIFSGLDNSLEMSQLYTVTYSCDFDLIMFPFDAQVCTIIQHNLRLFSILLCKSATPCLVLYYIPVNITVGQPLFLEDES